MTMITAKIFVKMSGIVMLMAILVDLPAGVAQAADWSAAGSMTQARYQHSATLLPDGKVLVVGGQGDSYNVNAEMYDPAGNGWNVAGSLSNWRTPAQYNHSATLLPNGKCSLREGII